MGLVVMIIGLAAFIGGHAFVTMRPPRALVIKRIGERAYKGLFSLLAIAGIVLIAWGFSRYRAVGYIDVWSPPPWTRHVTVLLVWPAIISIVAAYMPGAIKQKLKHPMLVGVKLWAAAHLVSNGDLGSIILFGSILAWAVFDRIAVGRRAEPSPISLLPSGGRVNDVAAVVVGTVLYFMLGFFFHPLVIGVRVFGA